MSIPFNDNLQWSVYQENPTWHKSQSEPAPARAEAIKALRGCESQMRRAVNEVFIQTFQQSFIRSFQCIRDTARLVLKVPVRAIWTPIVLPKNWKMCERSKINAKLTGYSFVQLVSVPAKFLVALAAIATSAISSKKAQWLLDKSEDWTSHLDGRASQLEALKEVGTVNASNRGEYKLYKVWLYSIDSKLCRREQG